MWFCLSCHFLLRRLVLTDEDRAGLGRLLESGSPRLAGRARIVLACAEPGIGQFGGGRRTWGFLVRRCGSGGRRFAEQRAGRARGRRPAGQAEGRAGAD